jgi:hypothetical protein
MTFSDNRLGVVTCESPQVTYRKNNYDDKYQSQYIKYWIGDNSSKLDILTRQTFHPRPLEDASQKEKDSRMTAQEYHVKL